MDDYIFIIIIAVAIIGSIARFIFWIYSIWFVGKTAYHAYQIYNNQMELMLQQIGMAIQAEENQQARILEAAMRQRMASLPREEKKIYKSKLNDVVKGKMKLNPTTGEWN